MNISDLFNNLTNEPQTARQVANKLKLKDFDSAVRIGSKLSKMFFNGQIERESIKIGMSYKKAYYLKRKVDTSKYADIRL